MTVSGVSKAVSAQASGTIFLKANGLLNKVVVVRSMKMWLRMRRVHPQLPRGLYHEEHLLLKWWPGSEATDKHMQIYFDESGDFNTARNAAYKFAFVVGIILPDRALQGLKADFDWFVGQLSSNEFRQGEPKGALLSLTHRQVLLEILKAHSDVMLIPLSVNLGFNDPSFFATAPARIRSLIENNLKTESSSMTIRERAALAKRFGRLSAPVMARLVSYGIAVLKAIESIACRWGFR